MEKSPKTTTQGYRYCRPTEYDSKVLNQNELAKLQIHCLTQSPDPQNRKLYDRVANTDLAQHWAPKKNIKMQLKATCKGLLQPFKLFPAKGEQPKNCSSCSTSALATIGQSTSSSSTMQGINTKSDRPTEQVSLKDEKEEKDDDDELEPKYERNQKRREQIKPQFSLCDRKPRKSQSLGKLN